ncbi:arginine--tRNA ligase [bacterium]|nr:arginine--tRNA ligase [FCB group bacterium]MBL7191069.1 arginine--tRNA ligase [bacterium]
MDLNSTQNKDIYTYLREALITAVSVELPQDFEIEFESPKDPSHGDISTNLALKLAGVLRKPPITIASEIVNNLPIDDSFIAKAEAVKPGFINFTYSETYSRNALADLLLKGEDYGKCDIGGGKRVLLEFVSANPTGPLNIVSARAAALGDSLKRIMNACGYRAESEFYVNDAGQQVLLLGHSFLVRHAKTMHNIDIGFPEGGYKGAYVMEMAVDWVDKDFDWHNLNDEQKLRAGKMMVDRIVVNQKSTLNLFNVSFDKWIYESEIRTKNNPDKLRDELIDKGLACLKDGAVYFKTSQFGDDEDHVIWTSAGRPTYFLPDIAYHQDKYERGFEWLIDIWGPDHHGYIPRMKAALKALGHPEDSFTVILAQQVNLMRGGEKVKMSKRAGEIIEMNELIEEVGTDAARFFFLQRKASAHLDFDLDLAVKETEENPVFYIQYAHARLCSIERFAEDPGIKMDAGKINLLKETEEFNLIKRLIEFPQIIQLCCRKLEPQPITVYLLQLASTFHSFYQKRRVVTDDRELSSARLALCHAVKQVIANGLNLIGVSAPDRM